MLQGIFSNRFTKELITDRWLCRYRVTGNFSKELIRYEAEIAELGNCFIIIAFL